MVTIPMHRQLRLQCSALSRAASTVYCTTAGAAAAAASQPPTGKHYVVVGAGLAGLATAYHLLKQSSTQVPVRVTVYDAVGIGAGGSGAAAGLLHPFAPTGKLLWRARDAMEAALELVDAAEAAAAQHPDLPDRIAWRTGMLKPVTNLKQSQSFWKLYGSHSEQQLGHHPDHHQQQPEQQHHHHHHHQQPQQQQQQHDRQQQQQQPSAAQGAGVPTASQQRLQAMLSGTVVDASTVQQLLPGTLLPGIKVPQQPQQPDVQAQAQRKRQRAPPPPPEPPAGWSAERSAALLLEGGITLQPLHYMQALWLACQHTAAARGDGSSALLKIQQLHSLADICSYQPSPQVPGGQIPPAQQQQQEQHQHAGGVDAIIVAAGAAVGTLAEIGEQLPLKLCQGYTLDMVPPPLAAAPAAAAAAAAAASGSTCTANTAAQLHPNAMQQHGDGVVAAPLAATAAYYPPSAPSVLGTPYMASQGGAMLAVGATKQYDLTPQQALAELGRMISPPAGVDASRHQLLQAQQVKSGVQAAGEGTPEAGSPHIDTHRTDRAGKTGAAAAVDAAVTDMHSSDRVGQPAAAAAADVGAAVEELVTGAAATWPGIKSWTVAGIRSGVRALPPKSATGAVPMAGRWMDLDIQSGQQQQQQQGQERHCDQETSVPVWLLVGLGARGLLYHAWLGKLMAAAVLSNSEAGFPHELLEWRGEAASTQAQDSQEE